jgi:hypothetical protein
VHILDSSNREIAQTSMGRICMALTQITRFMRRWKIERTFAGLQNFRRLLVRQVRILTVYRALFHFVY